MANPTTVLTQGQYWRPKPGQECNALIVWPFHYGDGDPEPLVYACQDVVTGECFNLHRSSLRQMWQSPEGSKGKGEPANERT
jgi:hypothetical protein